MIIKENEIKDRKLKKDKKKGNKIFKNFYYYLFFIC